VANAPQLPKPEASQALVRTILHDHCTLPCTPGRSSTREATLWLDSVAPCALLVVICALVLPLLRRALPTQKNSWRIRPGNDPSAAMPTRSTKYGSVRLRHIERLSGAAEAGKRQGVLIIGNSVLGRVLSVGKNQPRRLLSVPTRRDAGD